MARGNERAAIFLDDRDRSWFLAGLRQAADRYRWICHSYCLLGNHYHGLIETPHANLSLGMRQLNGVYAARFNRRHSRVGHLFAGRFKSVLVEKDPHALELARYIVLNPVRAGLCRHPREWRWSSYRALAGIESPPPFLTIDWLLDQLSPDRGRAHERYRAFVGEPLPGNPLEAVTGEIYLGTTAFIDAAHPDPPFSPEIPTPQRKAPRPTLDELFRVGSDAEIDAAVRSYGYRLVQIARHLGVHPSTVTRRLRTYADWVSGEDMAIRTDSRPDPLRGGG